MVYRCFFSPLMHSLAGPGWGCRFAPTCSEYAHVAVETHGFLRGAILSFRRVCRCHPLGPSGYDPVPLKLRGL